MEFINTCAIVCKRKLISETLGLEGDFEKSLYHYLFLHGIIKIYILCS